MIISILTPALLLLISSVSAVNKTNCYWIEKAWTGFGKQIVKDSNGQRIPGCCPGIPGIYCIVTTNIETEGFFSSYTLDEDSDHVNGIDWFDQGLIGDRYDAFDHLPDLKTL